MTKSSKESDRYSQLGASSSKAGTLSALDERPAHGRAAGRFFADLCTDAAGDDGYYSLLHADGAGTKSAAGYLAFRETGSTDWFESLAWDSLVMNLDDAACVNVFDGLLLSNTIGRNKRLIPDDAVRAVIKGYSSLIDRLRDFNIEITMAGGETADVGDLVRTIILDSTLFGRVKRSAAIDTSRIEPGDIIIGLSGTGQCSYESTPNSGIGSNGFTLARHALIHRRYAEQYPEIVDPGIDPAITYLGQDGLFDSPPPLEQELVRALLSPTRTYAPVLRIIFDQLVGDIHAAIHCSGGGQTKITNFGASVRYVKDNLFPCPPIFQLIQRRADVPWSEMYAVFNMGHRMELVCPERCLAAVRDICAEYSIAAQAVGRVEERSDGCSLRIESPYGRFEY